MVKIEIASWAYKALNGLICVYKPSCVSVRQVQHTIITNLCREDSRPRRVCDCLDFDGASLRFNCFYLSIDLNAKPSGPQEQRVEIVGETNAPMSVKLVPNYADDPLVCGPRYIQADFRCSWATHLGLFSSGVLLLGINDGTKLTYLINTARPTRAFKVHGQLGKATDTYFWNGKTIERATFNHVTREKIDRVVAHMQAAHQKTMYELSGVHMESQTMYEMASQGVIRPANSKLPVLYGIKCVHFNPPNFTLEVQSVNEYDKYLWTLIHDLGVQLKTSAHCTGVQCIRQGKFDLELALLRKHWQLPHIIDNMDQCRQLLEDNENLLKPQSARLS